MKNIILIMFVLNGLLFCDSTLPKKYRTLSVVSDGKGELSFRWFVPPQFWSEKGWVLTCDNRVLKKIALGKKTARYIGLLRGSSIKQEAKSALNMELFKIFVDFNEAKKEGFATVLQTERKGKRVYVLKAAGKNGVILKSKKIDAFSASALPRSPKNLRAKNFKKDIKLFWDMPDKEKFAPFAYKIYRKRADSTWKRLSDPYLITGTKWKKNRALFTDAFAPVEKKITYKVVGVDIFQRDSKPSYVSIFHPDAEALYPPKNVKAKALKNGIKIEWSPSEDPLTYGYVVERGEWMGGFFTLLTKKPLKRSVTSFTDKSAKAGISYIYRVRSVNYRGKQGEPSDLVHAKIKDDKKPKEVQNLKAKVYPDMIELSWKKSKKRILGYIIQKRYKGYAKWVDLNSKPVLENFYKDIFSYNAVGSVYYRIKSVSLSGEIYSLSKEIEVKLPGRLPLYAPEVRHIFSKKGKVFIEFDISDIGKKPDKILIHRGLIDDTEGKVIAETDPEKKRFVDKSVFCGKSYWYALESKAKDISSGKLGRKYPVKVSFGDIATPKKPKLTYVKKPFRYVKIEFQKPPENLGVNIYAKTDKRTFWVKIASGIKGDSFVDTDIPKSGNVSYKIVYSAPDMREGESSKAVRIKF